MQSLVNIKKTKKNFKSALKQTLQTSVVNDPAYIMLVYSHTKRNRRNNHLTGATGILQHTPENA